MLSMKQPGTDLNDPKVRSGAKAVATRKNNQFKKLVETKLPLFALELHAGYKPSTIETVIERRIECQANYREWRKEFDALVESQIKQHQTEIRQLCRNEGEFLFIEQMVVRMRGGSLDMKWYRALNLMRKRATEPLSPTADLVMAWLEQENEPLTHFDIWEKRGDGLTSDQILNALIELMSYAYADMCELVELPERFQNIDRLTLKTAWSWAVVRPE